jgi:hypothetical protein
LIDLFDGYFISPGVDGLMVLQPANQTPDQFSLSSRQDYTIQRDIALFVPQDRQRPFCFCTNAPEGEGGLLMAACCFHDGNGVESSHISKIGRM